MTELVFLPGWSFGPSIWNSQQALSDSYPCHFIDPEMIWQQIKGFSNSQGLTPVISALTELITAMKNPVIIGWSLGSLLALEIALKAGQSIKGLILTGATGRFTTATGYTGGLPAVIVKRMQRKLKADMNSTLTNFYDLIFTEAEKNNGFLVEISALQRENSVTTTSLDFLQGGLDYLLNTDLRGDITKKGGYWPPVLLVQGSKDTICPLDGAKTLAELLTFAGNEVDLVEIPEAGHAPFFTNAERFNRIIKNFLQKQVSGCD